MQGKMYVTVSDDLRHALVKIEDVSVKIYDYKEAYGECLSNALLERFESSKPSKIILLSDNLVTRHFIFKLKGLRYKIDEEGNTYHINEEDFEQVESKEDELNVVELTIEDEYRFEELCKILIYEGYTVSGEVNNGKFKVVIH